MRGHHTGQTHRPFCQSSPTQSQLSPITRSATRVRLRHTTVTPMETTTTRERIDDVPGGSRALSVVVVRPKESGRWPGVVMIHEAWGLDDVLVRQAEHLASRGYVVVAPDLFSDRPKIRCLVSTFRALSAGTGKPFADVQACQSLLRSDPSCTGGLGVIGFCMGGGFALLLANRGFDVSAVNYGMLPKDLNAALDGACPVVGSYGGRDKGLAGAADRLREGLEEAGVPGDVKEYPTAGHSFLNDEENAPKVFRPLMRISGAGPDPDAAADAWQRIEAFFAQYLPQTPDRRPS
ncbi:MAG: carboxymethylenebutenolidase [Propionibacteriaceae bacterium]|jgi:carboxymethylenebutenolidase|nr:carboxymethylenebutenolidase [Propionibacteriaceae bacterium]